MLRSLREGIKGRTGKVLLAIIIVPFVLFGAESLLTGGGGAAPALEVNGQKFDQQRLGQEIMLLRNETAQRMGENVDYNALTEERLRPQAIDRLVENAIIEQAFTELSLRAPERMIQQTIVQTPEFQVDGKFDNTRMSRVLADNGFNLNMLKRRLAEDIRLQQLRSAIGQTSFVASANTELLQKIFNEQRKAGWIEISTESVQIEEPTESELENYFEENRPQFVTQRTVDVEYLLVAQHNLVEPVTEEEILEEYDLQVAQFEAGERRRVSHILLEIGDGDEAAVMQRASDLAGRIAAGESFAKIAQENSADTATAEEGGDLGFTERDGTFPEPFEEAVYSLAVGEVSGPVRTEAGVHLIKVTELEAVEVPEFEELRDSIVAKIQERRARREYATLLERVADIAFNAVDLREPASIAGAQVRAVSGVAKGGLVKPSDTIEADRILSNERVLAALFSAEVLDDRLNSELIELSDTEAVVLRVTGVNEPRDQTFDEVRQLVAEQLRAKKLLAAVESTAAEVTEALRAGRDLESVASERGLQAKQDVELSRQSRDVPAVLRDAIFEVSSRDVGSAVHSVADASGRRQYVYRVDEVVEDSGLIDEQQKEFFARQMAAMTANQEITAFVQSLRDSAEIRKF